MRILANAREQLVGHLPGELNEIVANNFCLRLAIVDGMIHLFNSRTNRDVRRAKTKQSFSINISIDNRCQPYG